MPPTLYTLNLQCNAFSVHSLLHIHLLHIHYICQSYSAIHLVSIVGDSKSVHIAAWYFPCVKQNICVYACMCIYICMYICYTLMWLYIYIYMNRYIHMCIYICVCVCMYILMYINTFICLCIHTNANTHKHNWHVSLWLGTCLCVYVSLHVCHNPI